nr:uncharacterized protein LOC109153351 isoform X2 [Ipomoea batatas]
MTATRTDETARFVVSVAFLIRDALSSTRRKSVPPEPLPWIPIAGLNFENPAIGFEDFWDQYLIFDNTREYNLNCPITINPTPPSSANRRLKALPPQNQQELRQRLDTRELVDGRNVKLPWEKILAELNCYSETRLCQQTWLDFGNSDLSNTPTFVSETGGVNATQNPLFNGHQTISAVDLEFGEAVFYMAEKALYTVEETVERIERAAEVVDKVAENVADDLPAGKFRATVRSIENVAEKVDKSAEALGDFIDKVQEANDKVKLSEEIEEKKAEKKEDKPSKVKKDQS